MEQSRLHHQFDAARSLGQLSLPFRPSVAPETFDVILRDGEDLFHHHAETIGRTWDDVLELNWPLMGSMAARGELFVIGAREGERLVGYAFFLLGNDLFKVRLVASLVFLFALPEFSLLGLRLAREGFHEAKRRGASVGWLFRTRDSSFSARLDLLAVRLGAPEVSTTYELSLGAI